MPDSGHRKWIMKSPEQAPSRILRYERETVDGRTRTRDIESDGEALLYGNDTIGYHPTRHEAVGEAAMNGREGDLPIDQLHFEIDSDARRRNIRQKMRYVRVYRRVDLDV